MILWDNVEIGIQSIIRYMRIMTPRPFKGISITRRLEYQLFYHFNIKTVSNILNSNATEYKKDCKIIQVRFHWIRHPKRWNLKNAKAIWSQILYSSVNIPRIWSFRKRIPGYASVSDSITRDKYLPSLGIWDFQTSKWQHCIWGNSMTDSE